MSTRINNPIRTAICRGVIFLLLSNNQLLNDVLPLFANWQDCPFGSWWRCHEDVPALTSVTQRLWRVYFCTCWYDSLAAIDSFAAAWGGICCSERFAIAHRQAVMNTLERRRLFIATSNRLFYLSTYLSLCWREAYAKSCVSISPSPACSSSNPFVPIFNGNSCCYYAIAQALADRAIEEAKCYTSPERLQALSIGCPFRVKLLHNLTKS